MYYVGTCNKQKKLTNKNFVDITKATDEKSRIQSRISNLVYGSKVPAPSQSVTDAEHWHCEFTSFFPSRFPTFFYWSGSSNAVLGIRDILVRILIQIRIRGSIPLTNGSGSGSYFFRQ